MKWNHLHKVLMVALPLIGAVLFCTGIDWGLPVGERFTETPWTGQQILALTGGRQQHQLLGTDVDVDAITDRSNPIVLNDTDAKRAAILQRYRLYTHHPDEMITMMALSRMQPSQRRLDPGIYQYGGLWIYPVGALIKLASLTGWLTLKPDLAYYLDHPQEFGRFYLVARLYVVVWGVLGLGIIYLLARHGHDSLLGAAATTITCACIPVVLIAAHEAKPHLPGAVLMFLAVLTALKFLDTRQRRWWLATCIVCGGAIAMILTAWPILLILPLLRSHHGDSPRLALGHTMLGGLLASTVYFLCNPYVAWHLLHDPAILQSNLSNTATMFSLSLCPIGILNGLWILLQAIGIVPLLGVVAVFVSCVSKPNGVASEGKPARKLLPTACRLALLPAIVVVISLLLTAHEKPAEHARFAIFPLITVILAVGGLNASRLAEAYSQRGHAGPRHWITVGVMVLLLLVAQVQLGAFTENTNGGGTRFETAARIDHYRQAGAKIIGIQADPAPYIMPAINLFDSQLVLLPKGTIHGDRLAGVHLLVGPVDLKPSEKVAGYTLEMPDRPWFMPWVRPSMNWADKSFFILVNDQFVTRRGT